MACGSCGVGWVANLVAASLAYGIGAIWLTFLYNSSGGSVLMLILWHIVWNAVTVAGAAVTSDLVAVMNALVIPLGLGALLVGGPRRLSWSEKHVIEPTQPNTRESTFTAVA